MDTKAFRNSHFGRHKRGFGEVASEPHFLVTGLLLLIFSVVSTVVLVARQNDAEFLGDYRLIGGGGVRFFTYLVLYAQLAPLSVYFYLDLVGLLTMIKG
jgi:hypothetical protein